MSKYHKLLLLVIVPLAILAVIINIKIPMTRGLDIAGGIRVVMQADPTKTDDWPKTTKKRLLKMQSIRKTILERVKGLAGVSDPVVAVQDDDKLIVEMPGVKDPEKALERIQSTAALEFYYMRNLQSRRNPIADWSVDSLGEAYVFTGPQNQQINSKDQPEELLTEVVGVPRNKPILSGKDLLANARPSLNPDNSIVIDIEFNKEGTEKFANFTRDHVGEYLAVFYDGNLLTCPIVKDAILSGKAEVSGFDNLREARSIADYLNAGALPVPLKVIAKDTVEPTLGKETINRAVVAGIVGLALVMLFMLLYYRLPGFIAVVALALYALYAFAVFKFIHASMSLAGLAAFILSVGMAVDANILIFERLKEELRSGKTLRAAIDAGFNRAFTAIFDSNMCTAITCGILMWYGTPQVQNFAFTLLIGVAISMFTAITVTRTALHLLVGWEWAQKPSLYGLSVSWFARRGYTPDIIGKRTIYFAISAIVIIPGLVVLFTSGLKEGIEFKSGTSIQVSFANPANLIEVMEVAREYSPELAPEAKLSRQNGKQTMAFIKTTPLTDKDEYALRDDLDERFGISTREVRIEFDKTVTQAGLARAVTKYVKEKESTVDMIGGASDARGKEAIVRIKQFTPQKWDAVKKEIESKFKVASIAEPRPVLDVVATVLPTISKELTRNAFWAVVFASIGIILYVSFRFSIGGLATGFKYGCCAFFALVHDAAFLLGLFAILGKVAGWEINSLFVTAVLTVIGYSVHDSIVVFDRIRENLRHRQRGETYEQLANRSILQTWARSMNTSFTVVLVLGALLVLGGPLLTHFYVALLAGIMIGTYSSIFNATPLLVVWDKVAAKTRAPTRKTFEDKAIVSRPIVNNQPKPAQEPAREQVSDEAKEEPATEALKPKPAGKTGKSARIKRKKRRF